MDPKQQIDAVLSKLTAQKAIDIIESLGKKYRKANSVKLNAKQYGRLVDERPDEIQLKAK